jgi:hypothetical protein
MAIETFEGGTVITGAEIELWRLLILKGALKLEVLGMRHSSGKSVYARIKKEFNFKGSKQRVLAMLELYIQSGLWRNKK